MATLDKEIAFFSKADAQLKASVQRAIFKIAQETRSALVDKSPKSSGRLSYSWRVNKGINTKNGVIASASVFNPLSYAAAIEGGIDPQSEHPWAVSVRNKNNRNVVYSKGRIWSRKAIGGTIDTVLTPSYTKLMALRIADEVFKVFK